MLSRLSMGVVLALALGSAVAQSTPSTVSTSWFDQPLPASQHPLGPVAITAHSTSPGGISQIELLVEGTSVETRNIAGAPLLAEADFDWLPATDGVYWLVVRGQSGGQWGPSAAILVKIGQTEPSLSPSIGPSLSPSLSPSPSAGASPTTAAEPTRSPVATPTSTPTQQATPRRTASPKPTPTPTPRPTPTPTSRPTPTPRPTRTPTPSPRPSPCTPRAPVLVEPSDFYLIKDPALNPPTFLWRDVSTAQCPAAGFRIQVATAEDLTIVGRGNVDATLTRWTPRGSLADCQAYVWWVTPRKSDGSLGQPSESWHFAVVMSRSCGL
jgi:hypothetical protein